MKDYRNSKESRFLIYVLLPLLAVSSYGESVVGRFDTETRTVRLVEMTSGLSRPWSLAFVPGDDGERILITERTGALRMYDNGIVTGITGVPRVAVRGQGGLLDVAVHPDFQNNRLIYLSFSTGAGGGHRTEVGRGVLNGDGLEQFEIVFSMNRTATTTHHFGSRLAFDSDGMLFISTGDRGDRNRAQDLSDHRGKILRIHDDGTVPSDNPFVDIPGALGEIFSYGHRNPQGLVFDEVSGTLWAHEHGPRGGDEVNRITSGVNYGWPLITYGLEYSGAYIAPSEAPGLEQPVLHWTPSIAPSGLAVYRGDRFPEWRGNLFAGALAGEQLRRIVIEEGRVVHQEVMFQKVLGRIRDVRVGPEGDLWILTDSESGRLYRLEPAG